MKNNISKDGVSRKLLSVAIAATMTTTFTLSGCSNEGTGTSDDYITERACSNYVPPEVYIPGPVYTNDPIFNATELSAGISIDYAERLVGSAPTPAADGILNFASVAITDKSIQRLFVSGAVPTGKRIAAVFFGLDGTGEYFAVPVSAAQGTGSAEELPLQVTLRGPFPIAGTEPEPDIIQGQIINNLSVSALLVAADAPTPDLTSDLTALEADSSNWLAPTATPTITAENVGSGGIQVTLFWNQENDIDLWLIEPDDNKIYYAARNSVAGDGFLDFDNVTAYGPENIFFDTNIPAGTYNVQVNYFAGRPATDWSISVTACGSTATFSGRLDAVGDVDDVFSFDYGPDCVLDVPDDTPVDPRRDPSVFDEAVLCDD